MPPADVTCSGDILTVEREEHGRGGWHNRVRIPCGAPPRISTLEAFV
jgi:hypothetical protein